MKSWLIFGFGMVLGGALGAFLVTFIFFDELTQKSSAPVPRIAAVKTVPSEKPKATSAPSVVATPVEEARPVAVTAEAVDPDSLPLMESADVMATAKREDAAPSSKLH